MNVSSRPGQVGLTQPKLQDRLAGGLTGFFNDVFRLVHDAFCVTGLAPLVEQRGGLSR